MERPVEFISYFMTFYQILQNAHHIVGFRFLQLRRADYIVHFE